MKTHSKGISSKIILFAFIIPFILQITLFVYQITNKVLSIWNIVATAMMTFISINAVRMSRHEEKKTSEPELVTGGSTIDYSTPKKQKASTKSIVIKIFASLICIALSVLFFNIHNNKSKGLTLVNSTVISQQGEVTVETEETDDGITQTESEHIEVIVKYEFNGTTKQTTITGGNTHKIYVEELKIYIDSNGNFVSDYGRILVWKIEAIIFLCAAILLIITAIFSLGVEFIAGTIFLTIGLSLFFVIGCQFIENIWFNDLSCFSSLFVNIGIYMLIAGILNLVFPDKKDIQPQEPISKEESMANLKARLKQKYNTDSQTTSDETKQNLSSSNCKSCGAPMPESHKFCTHCGTKKD